MTSNRVTWAVDRSLSGKYRGRVLVDGLEVAKQWFDNEQTAREWCVDMARMAEAECRVR